MLFNFSFSVLLYTVALFALLHIYLAVILWYCLISEYISADDSGVNCLKINQKVRPIQQLIFAKIRKISRL